MRRWMIVVDDQVVATEIADFDAAYRRAIDSMGAAWQSMIKIDEDKKIITVIGGK